MTPVNDETSTPEATDETERLDAADGERALALTALRKASERLRAELVRDPQQARAWIDDAASFDRALDDALVEACADAGVSRGDVDEVVARDPDVALLKESLEREVLFDEQDPGPYDALSGRDPPGSQDMTPGTEVVHGDAHIRTRRRERAA